MQKTEEKSSRSAEGLYKFFIYFVLVLLAVIIIVPVAWVFMASIKQNAEFYGNPWALPAGFYWQNFVNAWNGAKMGEYMLNSVIVTALALALLLVVALPAAYCLSRFHFKGCKVLNTLFMAGLFIIALGAGGIKPCVSAFMGDQIPNKSPQLMTKAFNAFYWAINLGSFFSFLVIPAMEQRYGYSWAFAVPGLFMGVATFVFWLGRKKYHKTPPARNSGQPGFWKVLFIILFHGGWKNAEQRCGTSAVEDTRHILKILSIFAFIIPFWSIFEQTASSWVSQGSRMIPLSIPLPGGSWSIGPAQIQAANPIFVMVFIPLITVFVYPRVATLARPLVRLGTGLALSSATFLIVAFLQYRLEEGTSMSIAWQLIPYCVLTISEILVSTTGLEFAYTQAPAHLKSLITSFWNLTIFAGNMLVAAITFFLSNGESANAISTDRFILYAVLAAVVAVAYSFRARRYGKTE